MLNRNTHTQATLKAFLLHIKSLLIVVHFIERHSRILYNVHIHSSQARTVSIIQM